jgi:hypothetical protein
MSEPPTTIAGVIDRLQDLDARLPVRDGVAWFTKLYLEVTKAVQIAAAGEDFAAPEVLAHLDVVFADLYFDAVQADATAGDVPSAWAPLFEARADTRIAPIQFALAGMNAHINHDLAVAVVRTCRDLALEPRRDSSLHEDFEAVNPLIAQVEPDVKRWFATGFVAELDHEFHGVDDLIANFKVVRARDAAWTNAEMLWSVRGSPALTRNFLRMLDGIVGFAGHGLLVPTG